MDLNALHELIEPEARALGFDLVRVAWFPHGLEGNDEPTLQVMAERPDTRQLVIEDCATLSRMVSDRLDALEEAGRDPIPQAYRLEVSSPGIDRPLTRLKDFADWAGHEARLKLAREVDGAKQVSGEIEGVDGETIRIAGSKGTRAIPFDAVQSAKLLLTDKLIQATAPLSIEGADNIETVED